jgi:hypothetical protein
MSVLPLLLSAASVLAPHGEKAVVLLFVRTDCPISNRYAPQLKRLDETWSPRGFEFLLVYPEAGLTEAAMKEHGRQYGYRMRSVLDADHEYVQRAKAVVTPEAAVFVQGKLVYTGRIDDWFFDFGKARAQAEHHDLEDVLAAILAGKTPAYRETKAIGCAIENVK